MRRAANGPVTERLEPMELVFLRSNQLNTTVPVPEEQVVLLEFLYNHFQVRDNHLNGFRMLFF